MYHFGTGGLAIWLCVARDSGQYRAAQSMCLIMRTLCLVLKLVGLPVDVVGMSKTLIRTLVVATAAFLYFALDTLAIGMGL